MTRDEIIDSIWERANHGTMRQDIVEAFEAGEAAAKRTPLLEGRAASKLRTAAQAMHSIMRERHYGRMPTEVADAFQALGTALAAPQAAPAADDDKQDTLERLRSALGRVERCEAIATAHAIANVALKGLDAQNIDDLCARQQRLLGDPK